MSREVGIVNIRLHGHVLVRCVGMVVHEHTPIEVVKSLETLRLLLTR